MKIKMNSKQKVAFVLAVILTVISPFLCTISISKIGEISEIGSTDDLKILLIETLILLLLGTSFEFLAGIFKEYYIHTIWSSFHEKALNMCLNTSAFNFSKEGQAYYISLLNSKINVMKSYYYETRFRMICNVLIFVVTLLFALWIDWVLLILFVILLIPLALNNTIFPQYLGKLYDVFTEENVIMLSHVKEMANGFMAIKNNLAEKFFLNKGKQQLDKEIKASYKSCQMGNVSGLVAATSISVLQYVVVFYLGYLMLKQEISLTLFILAFQLAFFVDKPVIDFINAYLAYRSIDSIVEEFRDLEKGVEPEALPLDLNEVAIEKLNFSYQEGNDIFDNYDYYFEKGKKYLLSGESGRGKSTLLRLMLKQIEGYEGNILYSGHDLRDISEGTLFNSVAYISQDVFIFDENIETNIFFDKEHSEAEFKSLLKRCQLEKLYEQYGNTNLGVDNSKISGGERARLALARALVLKRPIMFCDEVLSSLDKENAQIIEDLLLGLEEVCVINVCHKSTESYKERYDALINIG